MKNAAQHCSQGHSLNLSVLLSKPVLWTPTLTISFVLSSGSTFVHLILFPSIDLHENNLF